MTDIATMEYFADGKCVRKCYTTIFKEIICLIFAGICGILCYFATKMQKMASFAHALGFSDEYYRWTAIKYILIVSIVLIVISAIVSVVDAIKNLGKLKRTHLAVSATTVSGVHFPEGNAGSAQSFTLPLNEILNVHTEFGRKARVNFEITHHTGVYELFAIEKAAEAADVILERRGLLIASYAANGYPGYTQPAATAQYDNTYVNPDGMYMR